MGGLDQIEIAAIDLIAPVLGVFLAVAAGKLLLTAADNMVAAIVLRLKGYRVHQVVRVNGDLATITQISMWSTHFKIANGGNREEYLAVSNRRLDTLEVRRLVRRYADDTNGGQHGIDR